MYRVLPAVPQPRRAVIACHLAVSYAPLHDGSELPEVPQEACACATDGATGWGEARAAGELARALLAAHMHAHEEAAAEEGHQAGAGEHCIGPHLIGALRHTALQFGRPW